MRKFMLHCNIHGLDQRMRRHQMHSSTGSKHGLRVTSGDGDKVGRIRLKRRCYYADPNAPQKRTPKMRYSMIFSMMRESFWCPLPESNQHSSRNLILSQARLPIPPKGQTGAKSCGMAPDYTKELVPVNRFLQKSAIHETLLEHETGQNNRRIYISACSGLQVTT